MNVKKAMVSSTALDLPEHRPAVKDACIQAGYLPLMMEFLPAQDADAISVSKDMVEQASVYIGIYAHRYGHVPKGHKVSITEMEFQHACHLGRRILPFLMHEQYEIKPCMVEISKVAQRRLKALKKLACKDRIARSFGSPDDLRGKVVIALTELLRDELFDSLRRQQDDFASLKMREAAYPEKLKFITELERKLLQALRGGVEKLLDAAAQPEASAVVLAARAALMQGDTDLAERWLRSEEESAKEADDLTGAVDASTEIAALATSRGNKQTALHAMKRAAGYRPDFDILDRLGDEYASMGDTSAALDSFQKARVVAACASGEDSKRAQRNLASSHLKIGNMLFAQDRIDEALAAYREALDIYQRLVAADPHNADWQRDLAATYDKVGEMLAAQGATDEPLDYYQRALSLRQRLVDENKDVGALSAVGTSYIMLGKLLADQGHAEKALDFYRKSLAISERLVIDHPQDNELLRDVSVSSNRVGDILVARRATDDAMAAFQRSMEIAERLAGAAPDNIEWQRDLSVIQDRIAKIFDSQGFTDKALDYYRQSLDIAKRLVNKDPNNAEWRCDLAVSHDRIADILASQGAFEKALKSYRVALTIRTALADNSNQLRWKRDLVTSHANIGKMLAALGSTEAPAAYHRALTVAMGAAATDQRNAELQQDIAMLRRTLADLKWSTSAKGRK